MAQPARTARLNRENPYRMLAAMATHNSPASLRYSTTWACARRGGQPSRSALIQSWRWLGGRSRRRPRLSHPRGRGLRPRAWPVAGRWWSGLRPDAPLALRHPPNPLAQRWRGIRLAAGWLFPAGAVGTVIARNGCHIPAGGAAKQARARQRLHKPLTCDVRRTTIIDVGCSTGHDND